MTTSSKRRRRNHYCPVVGCDHVGSFFPRFNLVKRIESKHPGIVIDNLPDTSICGRRVEVPTALRAAKVDPIPSVECPLSPQPIIMESTYVCAIYVYMLRDISR